MIRPVILAEYHQVKGPIVFLTLLLLFAASVLRLACGVVGAIVAMILLLFPLIQSVGVGPFEGEYAKGTFRFLNALPVNRGGIWLVKSVCGLLMALLCTSCLCIPLLGFPDATMGEVYALLRQIGVPLGSIGLLLGAWLLFGQAAGMLSVMMCTSRVTAQLLQLAVGYLPAGAFYLWFMVSRTLPSPQGVTLGLVTGAAVCFAGSFVLFVIRNPFLEQKWLWRGVGSGFIVLATAAMAASGLAMVLWPAAAPAGRFDRVVGAHASPDGRGIVVGTQAPMLQVHSYVLTAEGKLKFDLGGKVGLLHREITWCPAKDRTIVAYAEADLSPVGEWQAVAGQREPQLLLRDLETGELARLPLLGCMESNPPGEEISHYAGWSTDGRWLLGYKEQFARTGKPGWSHRVIGQDSVTGQVIEMLLGESRYSTRYRFMSEGRYATAFQSDETGQDKTVVVADIRSGTRQEFSLPANVIQWIAGPDCRSVVMVTRVFESSGVSHEVLQGDLESLVTETLVDRADLPHATLEQAARHQEGGVSVKLSPASQWLLCSSHERVSTIQYKYKLTYQLVYLPKRTRLTLPTEEADRTFGEVTFAPDDSKLLMVSRANSNEEKSRESAVQGGQSDGRDARLHVLALSPVGTQEILSLDVPTSITKVQWLGSGKIVYLRSLDQEAKGSASPTKRWMPDFLSDLAYLVRQQELWMIDLETGTHRPLRPDLDERREQRSIAHSPVAATHPSPAVLVPGIGGGPGHAEREPPPHVRR